MKTTLEEKENELLVKTLSCMGDGVIVTDIKGNVSYMNRVAEKLTGWELSKAKRKKFDDVFNVIDADTCKNLESPIKRAICARTSVGLKKDSILILDDGTNRYISASCSPVKGINSSIIGFVVVFRDISRLRKIEQELEEERNNFKAAFESAPIGMLILDESAQIKLANEYFLNMTNQRLPDVLNRTFGESIACTKNFEKKIEQCKGCNYCKIKRAIDQIIEEEVPIINLTTQYKVITHNEQKDIWFKLNFTS
ncbi:MAG TPA: PAS domain-containing protein, partial [Oscillospiraceae bacterium]|nr:PAS domain-containing protein [Oscillospiraceae bacterium]